jgi:excisionase family DNA binding protein
MNKQEAADFLGVSVRQIERYVSDNQIGVRYEKGRTKPTPVFDEGELRRFKEALERPVHRPAVHRMENDSTVIATQSDGGMSQVSALEIVSQMFQSLHANQSAAPPIVNVSDKLMLTVKEAATYSGVGEGAIDAAIKGGGLKAHRGKWRGRRIKRADVEKYFGNL